MSLNFNSSKQKQSIQEPTPAERELQAANTRTAQLQAELLQQQIEQGKPAADRIKAIDQQLAQPGLDPEAIRKLQGQRLDLGSQAELEGMQAQLERAATQNLLARATGEAPILTSAQQAALDQMFGVTQKRATEELGRFAQEQAGMRGLRPSDSPIFNESVRGKRDLEEGLAAAKTQAALNLGSSQDIFNQNLAQFQAQLRNQAFQSRMSLSATQPASYQMQNYNLAQRLPYMNTTTRGASGGLSGSEAQGAGSIMSALALAGVFSCYIAARLYGYGTIEFLLARYWIMDRWKGRFARMVQSLYNKCGARIAQSRIACKLLKPLFDRAVRRAARELIG